MTTISNEEGRRLDRNTGWPAEPHPAYQRLAEHASIASAAQDGYGQPGGARYEPPVTGRPDSAGYDGVGYEGARYEGAQYEGARYDGARYDGIEVHVVDTSTGEWGASVSNGASGSAGDDAGEDELESAQPGDTPLRSAVARRRPRAELPCSARSTECACGAVCVCDVPLWVLRPLASYFAGMHYGDPCTCGDPFCGFATYTTRLFAKGAYFRA